MNIIKSQQAIIACYFFAYSLSNQVFMWFYQNFKWNEKGRNVFQVNQICFTEGFILRVRNC